MVKVWSLYQQNNFIRWLPYLMTATTVASVMTWHVQMGWFGFTNAFLGLVFLFSGLWVIKTVYYWLLFLTFEKNSLSKQLIQYLSDNKFPKKIGYSENSISFTEYLLELSSDEQQEVSVRLDAVHLLGVMNAYKKSWLYQENQQLKLAFEHGFKCYNQTKITPQV